MDFVIFTSNLILCSIWTNNLIISISSIASTRYDLELFDYSPDPFYDIIKAAQTKTSWELRSNGRHTWSSQFQIRQKLSSDLWDCAHENIICWDLVAYYVM